MGMSVSVSAMAGKDGGTVVEAARIVVSMRLKIVLLVLRTRLCGIALDRKRDITGSRELGEN